MLRYYEDYAVHMTYDVAQGILRCVEPQRPHQPWMQVGGTSLIRCTAQAHDPPLWTRGR